MSELVSILLSVVASVSAIMGGWLLARRMGKLGLGDAQLRLNAIYRELNEAWEDQVTLLRTDFEASKADFVACKTRLTTVESDNARLQRELDSTNARLYNLITEVETAKEKAKP